MTERATPARKRRICFVTKAPVFGGTERHLLDLVSGLDSSRVMATLVCLRADVFSGRLNQAANREVEVVTLAEPAGFWGYRAMFSRLRADVVVFVVGELGLFRWPAYLAARTRPTRRVIGIEHLIASPPPGEPPSRGSVLGRIRGWIGWRARHIAGFRLAGILSHTTICVSEAVRRRLVGDYGYPPERTITIPNGVDVEHYRADAEAGRALRRELKIREAATVIVCVASLVPQKRVDLLLEALGTLRSEVGDFCCLILGDGPLMAKLVDQAETLRLLGRHDSVRFVGFVTDVRPYLQAGDLFTLSSDKEGMPLALLEAMASSLACIVTDVGGNAEVLVEGETGMLVEPGSSGKLADALRYALTHPDEMRTLGHNARRWVQQQSRLESTVRRLAMVICDG